MPVLSPESILPPQTAIDRRTGGAIAPWRRGFTIVELLVVIAIIALLVGILLPALGAARGQAARIDEMAAARDLMVAWNLYADDNSGRVLPGYKSQLPAYDLQGNDLLGSSAGGVLARRYPWRIVPYLGDDFRSLYRGPGRQDLEAFEQLDNDTFNYVVSVSPALGYNATWIGGDENELGFDPVQLDRYGQFYVKARSQVFRPSALMAFGSARGVDTLVAGGTPVEGFFRIRSPWLIEPLGPRWTDAEWKAGPDPSQWGFVSLRYRRTAVAAYVDGHVAPVGERDLRDMRMWANRADAKDWGLVPEPPPGG